MKGDLATILGRCERLSNGCLQWTMALDNRGYAQASLDGEHRRLLRVVYQLANGVTLDRQATVDHTCHDPDVCTLGDRCPHRACLEPSHLEAVPPGENQRRGRRSRCRKGHPMDGVRRYRDPSGVRIGPYCKQCNRDRARDRQRRDTGHKPPGR